MAALGSAWERLAAVGLPARCLVGIALFMGINTTPGSAVVQSTGQGYRLDRSTLMQAFEADVSLRRLLLRQPRR